MINIKGLSKAEVLVCLYNALVTQKKGLITIKQAKKILSETTRIEYLHGKAIKIDLSSDTEFDERFYDRDNGIGSAARAIEKIKRHEK